MNVLIEKKWWFFHFKFWNYVQFVFCKFKMNQNHLQPHFEEPKLKLLQRKIRIRLSVESVVAHTCVTVVQTGERVCMCFVYIDKLVFVCIRMLPLTLTGCTMYTQWAVDSSSSLFRIKQNTYTHPEITEKKKLLSFLYTRVRFGCRAKKNTSRSSSSSSRRTILDDKNRFDGETAGKKTQANCARRQQQQVTRKTRKNKRKIDVKCFFFATSCGTRSTYNVIANNLRWKESSKNRAHFCCVNFTLNVRASHICLCVVNNNISFCMCRQCFSTPIVSHFFLQLFRFHGAANLILTSPNK